MKYVMSMLLLLLTVLATSGCSTLDVVTGKPPFSVHAITPSTAASWADNNQHDNNARLYVIRSKALRTTLKELKKIGINVPLPVKEGQL